MLTGSNIAGSLQRFPVETLRSGILPRAIPADLYSPTASETLKRVAKSYLEITNSGEKIEADASITELQSLHSISGLTWGQLAKIFNVSVRLVHFWQNKEKKMTAAHSSLLSSLRQLIMESKLPSFMVRKVFEEKILSDAKMLREIQGYNLSFLEDVIKSALTTKRPASLAISDDAFESRMPETPMSLMGEPEDVKSRKTGKTKVARIARSRKKS